MKLARSTPPQPRRQSTVKRLTVSVRLGGTECRFRLLTRPLTLGPDTSVNYHWMDASDFRITQTRRKAAHDNLRNCIGHWWAAMQASGVDRDPDQIRHLLLASSYAVVSGAKTTHQVVPDAY